MPTFVSGTPKSPAEDRLVDDALAFGRMQWSVLCVPFFRQWSQPGIIKLAELILGQKAIHSSQIHGSITGKLRDYSPKVLMALGEVNLAIAAANGEDVDARYKVPETRRELWEGKRCMRDAQGRPLGPSGVFEVITGLVDLGIRMDRQISPEAEEEVSLQLGKFLRLELAKKGVDYVGDMTDLRKKSTCIEDLIFGKTVQGSVITDELSKLAALVEVDEDTLWNAAIAPALI